MDSMESRYFVLQYSDYILNMRLAELREHCVETHSDLPDRLQCLVEARMAQNINRFNFRPSDAVSPASDYGLTDKGYETVSAEFDPEHGWLLVHTADMSFFGDNKVYQKRIPFSDLNQRRNELLLDETTLPGNATPHMVEEDVRFSVRTANGFHTDLGKLIQLAHEQGLVLMSARASCGAESILGEHGISSSIEVSSLVFHTTDTQQDLVDILYLGPGATNIKDVEETAFKIAHENGFPVERSRRWG